jgi:hypothetical protein
MPLPRYRLALAILAAVVGAGRMPAQGLPERLSDSEFWHLVSDMSEPNGYFRSENMVSNEMGFETVIPALLREVRPGGVYLGVGPEQNFTYIAALHPAMAFIIDIRHQNAMQHLIYKALFELSATRADFIANLFSRPRARSVNEQSSVDSLFASMGRTAPDSALHVKTLAAIKENLVHKHGFTLDTAEMTLLVHNFDAMYELGPDLNYNSGTNANSAGFNGRAGRMPTYGQLMVLTDSAGVERSYLSSEANYRVLRDLEGRNMLIPLTGDFAGPKAIRAVGDYVRTHHAVVTTFYTSNVEQYLFMDQVWLSFERNVATMPLDSTSRFIRSAGAGGRGSFGGGGGSGIGMRLSLTQSMMALIKATDANQITTYQDVLAASH